MDENKKNKKSLISALSIDRNTLTQRSLTRSLGRFVEDMYDPVPEVQRLNVCEEEVNDRDFIRGFTNWYRLQFFYSHSTGDSFFNGIMSQDQKNSYLLLFDWWTAAFQHPSVPIAYLFLAVQAAPTLAKEDKAGILGSHPELWGCMSKHVNILRPTSQDDPIPINPVHMQNQYAMSMWQLFRKEFINPEAYDANDAIEDMILRAHRRDAAIKAYCQQAGMECMRERMPEIFIPDIKPFDEDSKMGACEHIYSLHASDPGSPRSLGRGPLIDVRSWARPVQFYPYADSVDEDDDDVEDGDKDSRGVVHDRLEGWPEYLWDVTNGFIIPTKSFSRPLPAYTAISHTWGRSVLPGPGYTIPGGLKYPIPLNSAFDVTALPETLRNLRKVENITTEYVWIDLICIPQGDDAQLSQDDENLKLKEIARQASIFQNATTSIAWLHEVQDLSCVEALFQWLCMSTVDFNQDKNYASYAHYQDLLKSQALHEIRDQPTGLVQRKISPKGKEIELPPPLTTYNPIEGEELALCDPWFDSLWTLQELCIRPNMILANKDLKIMSLKGGQPIPLNGLICLYNQYVSMQTPKEEEDVLPALRELSDWERSTGLQGLLDFSLVDVLKLAAHRYCGGRRSEAFMSAMGATLWFEDVQAGRCEREEIGSTNFHPSFIEEIGRQNANERMSFAAITTINNTKMREKEFKVEIQMSGGHSYHGYLYSSSHIQKILGNLLLDNGGL